MWQYAKSTQQYKAQVQILYFVESDTSLTKEDILVKKKKNLCKAKGGEKSARRKSIKYCV